MSVQQTPAPAAEPQIRVRGNRPRLLEPGTPPPPTQATTPTGSYLPTAPGVPLAPYWTADKAAKFLAQGMRSLSKLYGPDMKLSEVEIDLLGPPAAAVMNDWMPLQPGEQGDKQANLIYLVAVVGLLVLFRLPDILEAHDMLPDWAAKNRAKAERRAAAAASSPAAAPAPDRAPVAEAPPAPRPQDNGFSEGGDRWKLYEPRLVGGGGFAQPPPA